MIGKVKILPFVSMIYGFLISTSNPPSLGLQGFFLHYIKLLINEFFYMLGVML